MSYLTQRGSVYYFRRVVPDDLKPILRRQEIMKSLRTKDRETAKRLIPIEIMATDALFDDARSNAASVNPKPTAPKSLAQLERERAEWEGEQERAALLEQAMDDQDSEIEALEPIMDALAEGREIDASPADIARAGRLLVLHEREIADIDRQAAIGRVLQDRVKGRASEAENQAIECEPVPEGKGIYLDTDIISRWVGEVKPGASAINMYTRDAKLFNSTMGRKSVELITKADVMAYKFKLIDDPKRSQVNVRDRLANLRTLLEIAAQADLIPDNPARNVRMRVTESREKRADWTVAELNTLFAGPVHAEGHRPKRGNGEAAYWLPLIAVFMGARREEIGQLQVDDVRQETYFDDDGNEHSAWCLNITDDDEVGNRVKNAYSRRLVPIHPKLIEFGFVDYVKGLPKKETKVFPMLKRVGERGRLTDKFGQWFTMYRRELGIADGKVFHGLRHTWKTQAVNSKIEERVSRQFQGHEGKDVADKYGGPPSMQIMVEAIASYRIPGLKLPTPKG